MTTHLANEGKNTVKIVRDGMVSPRGIVTMEQLTNGRGGLLAKQHADTSTTMHYYNYNNNYYYYNFMEWSAHDEQYQLTNSRGKLPTKQHATHRHADRHMQSTCIHILLQL